MNNRNETMVVCAQHKVAVEVKAEEAAERGYKMIDAPFYDEQRGCWCHRLKRPESENNE